MLLKLTKGDELPVCSAKSDPVLLVQYFAPLVRLSGTVNSYRCTKNVIVEAVRLKKDHAWSLSRGVENVAEMIEREKEQASAQKEPKRRKDEYLPGYEIRPLDKHERRILWVSRHNMQLKAYLSLTQDLYPDENVNIYPCQPRVNEALQVIRIAEEFGCSVICAILPDAIFEDMVHIANGKIRILRPILSVHDTGRSYSPKGSFSVRQQKEYMFHGWRDMENHQVYGGDRNTDSLCG